MLKYLTLNASHRVAEAAQQRLYRHIQGGHPTDPELPPEQAKAMERVAMRELADDLRQAHAKIPEDAPRPPEV